ncbi:MAG TPA: protocatechuate 3,4-dioxygenase subunit alpha [Anaeromyxobacteraceae bacterium]|nr:protocatechuate 3,4-dioxygenase subunit alpha [Anaeromyxobacteraceae bacterium]
MSLYPTASQTVGPYLRLGLDWLTRGEIAGAGTAGKRVTLVGRVLDGRGRPVDDALVEIWQADANGKYAHPADTRPLAITPGFRGFGRVPTDASGTFRFATVKPGRVPGPDGKLQAPHLAVNVFMRGLLRHLVSRMYFPDEASNADDPVLNLVEPARRATLIGRATPRDPSALEWDVVLQGADETVFFET